MEGVQAALATLSSLEDVKKGLRDGSLTLPVKLQQLLLWVFGGGLRLRSLSKTEAERVMTMPGRESDKSRSHPQPHVVLEVQGPGLSNWEERVASESSLWAFHGSRLDNFHSILNFGLQQHRNKVSLFGEGIYLARDLGVCLAYSHRGQVGHRQWLNRTTTIIISDLAEKFSRQLHISRSCCPGPRPPYTSECHVYIIMVSFNRCLCFAS